MITYPLQRAKDGEALYSQQIRPGSDCGSDHELLIAEFRLKLKKVGKTTGPFRYALNQIPFDYVVDVMERFKGLVPEELRMEVCNIVQEVVTKTIPKKKKCRKAKWLSEKAFQVIEKRSERQGRKRKIYPTECRAPENSQER